METKIIKAVFGGGRYAVTAKRTRTDYGQVLEFVGIDLPETFECIFSNSDTSAGVGKKMIGSAQRVLIPDEYLQTGQTIYAWVLVHDGNADGRHMYSVKIPVADMPDTSPEEPTPVEQSVISQAIAALNSAVDTTSQKASEASASADRAEHAADVIEGYAERAEAAQSAAESARDIALEAKVSAQTSAATASTKASEAISSATTASQSALTAESASESASASADASAQSASQASQSADTASGKASDASGYASSANTSAQTASQKALEASQSASTATQAKTDAESAKTASETAQGLAESARDGAVTAKTYAESARDEAQSIADGITVRGEQIDSNTDRIESLEDDRYKPYVTDTASGAVASFPDGADDIPLKSCIVRVEPVQAGSGDPSPENERPISGWTGCEVQRTGKNLLSNTVNSISTNGITFTVNEDRSITVNGTATARANLFYSGALYIPPAEYYLSVGKTFAAGQCYFEVMLHKAATGSNVYINTNARSGYSFTVEKGDYIQQIYFSVFTGKTVNDTIYPQIELGSTATPYEPYTGQTYPITFPTETGTVYGGYVDVLNGKFVVDRAGNVYDGSSDEAWQMYGIGSARAFAMKINVEDIKESTNASEIVVTSNELKAITPGATWGSHGSFISTQNGRKILVAGINTITTVADWMSYLASSPLQVVYKLAEPIEIQLSENQINSLLGQNNLWADTGDTEVEYRADTTLYINKKIAEAVSALS